MSKRLQTDECHFVSIKSLNFKSHSFSIFTSLFFLFAGCCFQSTAHAQQNKTSLPSKDTLVKSSVGLTTSTSTSEKLFSYPSTTFRAGTEDPKYLFPEVFKKGGGFSYRRVSTGAGGLNINLKTGALALMACDPGIYEIFYTLGSQQEKIVLTISK
jgi:hypothetical protein